MTTEEVAKVNLSPRQDWPDAELLYEGFLANPGTLRALQQLCGFSDEQAASACLVSLRTYRRWRSTGKPDPTALRLLAILAGFIPWTGWDDWEMHRGYLFPPGFSRHGITPGQVQAVVFYRQQASEYRRRNAELTERVRVLEAERTAAVADAAVGTQVHALGVQTAARDSALEFDTQRPE
ncbi:hypothetical protein [Imhoffiella purpurea]|uniref:Uncharacterized protein n=1 Tax=Imhoffiella purpurea TaxID=1249627 RepID=W9VE05_9GAMM|nr:hypothetical protein [Imhoffiella purpurea]EXJ14277.1 hypothetical protein D779_2815 [Imhoffiella purpurea]